MFEFTVEDLEWIVARTNEQDYWIDVQGGDSIKTPSEGHAIAEKVSVRLQRECIQRYHYMPGHEMGEG